ncbi:MAG: SDR family NAD(P)-dependent oxidoreductase [Candidatus Shapirobacteria bacterium]
MSYDQETSLAALLSKNFKGKNILVTGGTGSIGSEIVVQLTKYQPKKIVVYARSEYRHFLLDCRLKHLKTSTAIDYCIGDIRDKDRLESVMEGINIIFHTAGLKHVPVCEHNPQEAIKTNILGSQNIFDLAVKYKINKVIAISSDKAVNPTTFMGMTKLVMERLFIGPHTLDLSSNTIFSVIRFGNVLDSCGSVIPLWREQIKNNEPVTVTDKRMKRFFTTIPKAVNSVLLAASIMNGQELFVLNMHEFNIYQMAKKLIKKSGVSKKIDIVFTGSRENEKVKELLYTSEEIANSISKKPFLIILPNQKLRDERASFYKI